MKTKTEQQQKENIHSATISHAVDIKSNFELYAYRCISEEIFIARTIELNYLLSTVIEENTPQ